MTFGMFAADVTTLDLGTLFSTAVSSIQTQLFGLINGALPAILAIVGTILVIAIGIKLVKRFAK